MARLSERLDQSEGRAVLRANGVPAAQVADRIEQGESPERIGSAMGLDPLDLIAALAFDALGDDASEGIPLVHERARRPGLRAALAEDRWQPVMPRSSRPARLGLSAGLLQIADHWEASHQAAQLADDLGEPAVAAYWHAIAHRREPDPGNAAYWFRRVGRHPVFALLADSAAPILEAHGDPRLTAKLLPQGAWNPFAFIDHCAQAGTGTKDALLPRRLQRVEMILLLEATCAPLHVSS